MPFETPIAIREVIQRIHSREYLLPGIQREFVWDQDQICRLFDSLLRGYPIGSFLFWRVSEEHKNDYKFYEFLRDYHEHDSPHNPKASLLPVGSLTAVLDGQQRLTSLYIGLIGTHTARRKYARRSSLGMYSKRRLYLNLTRPAKSDEALFDFRFREADDRFFKEGDDFWFRVSDILSFARTTDVFDFLLEHGLTQNKHPKTCLVELHSTITELPLINYFTEVEQDLDRVLNIFIREGFAIENFIAAAGDRRTPYYYRTEDGAEIDLLFERGDAIEMILEIKRSTTPVVSKGFRLPHETLKPGLPTYFTAQRRAGQRRRASPQYRSRN